VPDFRPSPDQSASIDEQRCSLKHIARDFFRSTSIGKSSRSLTLAAGIAVAGCSAGGPIADRPKSYLAFRFEATTPQQRDFTCGAASLATLITFYWGQFVTEDTALATLKNRYSDAEIAKLSETGLSFDDLIYMANRLGFAADGARLPLDQLAKLAGPLIVHLDKGALKHFVVLRRVGDGVYYVSDPIVGQVTMNRVEFAEQYTGNALAVYKPGQTLPRNAVLENPRDGVRVQDSLTRVLNVPNTAFYPRL